VAKAHLAVVASCLFALTIGAEPARHTDSFTIGGAVEHPRTVTLGDLQLAPQTTADVTLKTNHGPLTGKFTGVPLWSLLQEAGIKSEPGQKMGALRRVVIVTSSDGFQAVLSVGELSPDLGDDKAIVATREDGKPLDGQNGFARLIVPTDKEAARAVGAIASIEVR
jgi:DMSO/TMAO reductase YedYZ molybdopterin-dependent catalytic subunit